jgi:hypothetical protein
MRYHPLIGLYYLFNLIISSLLAWPFITILSRILSSSRAGERVFEQQDPTILMQLFHAYIGSIPVLPIFVGYVFIYVCLSLLISGGTLYSYTGPQSFSFIRFLQGGSIFYFRFMRLFLVFLAIVVIFSVMFILITFLTAIAITMKLVPLLYLLFFFVVGILLMIFDYARIFTVIYDMHKVRHALKEAIVFVIKHFFSVYFLYVLYLIPLLVLLISHFMLPDLYRMGSIIAFIYGQLVVVVRSCLRLSLLAGQTIYAQAMHGRHLHSQV